MSIPDSVLTGVAVAGTLQAAKQAQDFIAAAAGHPGESIGTILGNITHRRIANIEAIGAKANLTLLNIGVKAGEVPLNVLHPLLEGASLQEEEFLRDTWANMLANAADERQDNAVPPSFPGILKELRSNEVRFLDALFTAVENVREFGGQRDFDAFSMQRAYQGLPGANLADLSDYTFSMNLLVRNQLISTYTVPQPIPIGDMIRRVPSGSIPASMKVGTTLGYHFTELAMRFVRACRKPSASTPVDDVASA